ncbi:RNA pseudouridine synthase [Spirochaetia bacterium]|nr:RNA pseudouridine synthase [Spirochaetia bacterium]
MYCHQAHRTEPYVLSETKHYAVVYKPPLIHSVPLKKHGSSADVPTLLDWYGRIEGRALKLSGRKDWEGGLLHRLDYETEGLVLIAKTQQAMDALLVQQEQGLFIKEYRAISAGFGVSGLNTAGPLPGFPPFLQKTTAPSVIQSYFRPWGPGRKAVRPVIIKKAHETASDRGKPYVTEVLKTEILEEGTPLKEILCFTLRIKRGFRHQIRCHLAWMGKPILNDALYGGAAPENSNSQGGIALRAAGFSFYDPEGGEKREYRLLAD